jgi:class 3 adenylate cyclase
MTGWQRHIDHAEDAAGCHIGMALGDLSIVSARPFSRTYTAGVGEAINVASRLTAAAGVGEIVVSNGLHRRLSDELQDRFERIEAVDAKNIGRIRAWRLGPGDAQGILAAL